MSRTWQTTALVWAVMAWMMLIPAGCDDGGAEGAAETETPDVTTDAGHGGDVRAPDVVEDTAPDPGPTGPTDGELAALTYNVHGLPEAISKVDPVAQMTDIAPLLGAFDLVGLQEDFMAEAHEVILEASPHLFRVWFSDLVEDRRVFGSGLTILAEHEPADVDAVHYETCHGRFEHASDCLASKGFQRVRLRLSDHEGATLDVYNTHLDAGGSEGDEAARATQVAQIIDSLSTWSAGRAVVLLGDLNLHADEPPDLETLTALMNGGDLTDSCAAVACPEPNHIDRVLVRDGDDLALEVLDWRNEDAFFDEDGAPLSDHPAISARIGWSVK
ncbi:MAG: endonuclease/exonuclease/phosphatase family protein [Myxococcota bacterium]